jgi:hypothetical protein
MNSYKLTTTNMQKEKDTIHQILINNKYDPSSIEDIQKGKKNHQKQETEKPKWAKFTYVGKETRFITKTFKNPTSKLHSPQTIQ